MWHRIPGLLTGFFLLRFSFFHLSVVVISFFFQFFYLRPLISPITVCFLIFFYFSSSVLFKTCLVFSLCVRLNWGGSRGCPGCPDTRPFDQGAHFEKNSVNKYHRECIKTRHFDIRNTKIFSGGAGRGHSFSARPPVPLSDGLHTRPCKILDPPLQLGCQFSSANRLSYRIVSYRVCSG